MDKMIAKINKVFVRMNKNHVILCDLTANCDSINKKGLRLDFSNYKPLGYSVSC